MSARTRQQVLREYLLMVMSSDLLSTAKTKADVLQGFGAALLEDASVVVGDMAATFAAGVTQKAGEHASTVGRYALDKLGDWLQDARKRGFKRAWSDLQEIYWRGVNENGRQP